MVIVEEYNFTQNASEKKRGSSVTQRCVFCFVCLQRLYGATTQRMLYSAEDTPESAEQVKNKSLTKHALVQM